MNNSTDLTADAVIGGHADTTADMTADTQGSHLEQQTLNLLIFVEHEFSTGFEGEGHINITISYRDFTQTIVSVYHGNHSKDEICSALHLVEEHLTILYEDLEHLSVTAKKFITRAINFTKKFIDRINGIILTDASTDHEKEVISETFEWKGTFVQLVEIIDALIEGGFFGNVVRARLIRAIFKLFGINKTVSHYNAARNKCYQKPPREVEDDEDFEDFGRSTILKALFMAMEERWHEKYMTSK